MTEIKKGRVNVREANMKEQIEERRREKVLRIKKEKRESLK